MLGGGAVTAALLARPGILHAGADEVAAKAEPQRGKVKIRDVQSASIADEYVCNLIKITTDSGLYGIGEARCKIPVAKQVKAFNELVVGEDPLRVDYLTRKMMAAIKRPSMADIGVVAGIETALWDLAGKILNTPTYNLLGGACRDRIKVYHDLAPADTPKTTEPELWLESAQGAKKGGFKAMKVDIYRGGGDVPEWGADLVGATFSYFASKSAGGLCGSCGNIGAYQSRNGLSPAPSMKSFTGCKP